MIKAVVDNKVVEVLEVVEYENGYQDDLVEIFFMFNGVARVGAVIRKSDLIIEEVSAVDKKVAELLNLIETELCEEAIVDAYEDGTWLYVESDTYTINIFVDDEEFSLSTLHNDNYKNYGVYDEKYRNVATRKSIKGVVNYIKRFVA